MPASTGPEKDDGTKTCSTPRMTDEMRMARSDSTVDLKDDLDPAALWTAILTNVAHGNTFHFSVTNSGAAPLGPRRFYRVRVL